MKNFFKILENEFYILNNYGLHYLEANKKCFEDEDLNILWLIGITMIKNGEEPECVNKVLQAIAAINNDFSKNILLIDILLLIQMCDLDSFIKLKNHYL